MTRYRGPDRVRDKKYLAHIRLQNCLICHRTGVEAHHLTFAQPRAMASKTGDQYVIPLCREHHHELHHFSMGERTYWAVNGVDPLTYAEDSWESFCAG